MTKLGVASFEVALQDALSLGARALAWSESSGAPALVSAACDGRALVLGQLQREDTLRERSPARFENVQRRPTTGTEAWLEGEVVYHALALPRVSSLFADASARTLLNRNLRAILRGYSAAGVPLRYFGTEVLALLGHPVALVGYEQAESGAVLIEVWLGLQQPCVVRSALKREAPRSLSAVMGRELRGPELMYRAVSGIVERLQLETVEVALPAVALAAEALPKEPPAAVSIPLGVVEAAGSRITGDLLVSTAALARVEALAQSALDAGEPLTEAVLLPLQGAPLDGAKPADLLQALVFARQL
ncbi:MAG: hypothetical protein EOO73_12575 [Myxococcales bacterium]|nr:MAG: hypothetical protein EOO73_12575 [Myxococcales bacterium]